MNSLLNIKNNIYEYTNSLNIEASIQKTIKEDNITYTPDIKNFIKYHHSCMAIVDPNLTYLAASAKWLKEFRLKFDKLSGLLIKDSLEKTCIDPLILEYCLYNKTKQVKILKSKDNLSEEKWIISPWFKEKNVIAGLTITKENYRKKNCNLKTKEIVSHLKKSNSNLENFASICAHDLRAPLRTMGNFIYLLNKHNKGKFDQISQQYINFISRGALQMDNLVKGILEYSKNCYSSLPYAQISVNEIIKDIEYQYATSLKEHKATVKVDSLPTIIGNKTQITQLFKNLLENSLKYRSSKNPEISISATYQSNYWHFRFTDNGIGIKPSCHKKVFLMFQRSHDFSKYEGAGIGLALCKKIVNYHGGDIKVSNNLSGGCTFDFTLSTNLNKYN